MCPLHCQRVSACHVFVCRARQVECAPQQQADDAALLQLIQVLDAYAPSLAAFVPVSCEHDTLYAGYAGRNDPSLRVCTFVRVRCAQERVVQQLRRVNSEFANYVPTASQHPTVTLHAHADPTNFPAGVKHKWTR